MKFISKLYGMINAFRLTICELANYHVNIFIKGFFLNILGFVYIKTYYPYKKVPILTWFRCE